MSQVFLSLCMIVKNESQNLARCLESVKEKVDEIIIVDTGSSDDTKEIALSYGAKIYDYEWQDDFAAARNHANKYATGEWIISLDADEQIVTYKDIKALIRDQSDAIICNLLFRYNTSINSPDIIEAEGYYFRVFRRLPDLNFKGKIHEQLFYKDRPLIDKEVRVFFKDQVFIKHYGTTDGKSLKKCIEFYLPMLERISSKEKLSLMELYSLDDYYKKIGEFDKSLNCYEEAFHRLMPNLLTGNIPSDFVWVPSWLNSLGNHFLNQKDLDNLCLLVTRGLQWCSNYPPILNIAGKTLLELGFHLGALAYFQSCIDYFKTRIYYTSALFESPIPSIDFLAAESYYWQGYIYIGFEEWDKAATSFESCLSIYQDFNDAKEKLFFVKEKLLSCGEINNETILSKQSSNPNLQINNTQIGNDEINIIQQFISSGNVVFDVGANVGNWSAQVLGIHNNVELHLFEAIPQTYYQLIQNFGNIFKQGNIFPNNLALSNNQEIRDFYFYNQESAFSTMYRRVSVEDYLQLTPPTKLSVPAIPLDDYCLQRNIHHINFLKIDVEGAELDVLLGASQLLKSGSIDIVQFEYGGTYQDAGITLEKVYALLERDRYFIFKITSEELEFIPFFSSIYEDYQYSNFLAINERICPLLMGEEPRMLDLPELFFKHQIKSDGVIHIGAHEGQEVDEYLAMSFEKILLIEANPEVYQRLQNKIEQYDGREIYAVNCAISNYNGESILRVTSADQSSSLLPLKLHSQIYPQITEQKQLSVTCKMLDTLLEEISLDLTQYNFLNIDIQGAELLALQGATHTLQFINAINIEVNYAELYEGCVLVHELDEFLSDYGFERVATISPYHSSWGDAFYVKKPIITMTTLGRNGRFANQIFQYAFLRIYAEKYNLRVETSPWIGNYLFGHKDPIVSVQLPVTQDLDNSYEALAESILIGDSPLHSNVDFLGYFQYHSKYYAPYKSLFCSLFQPIPEIASQMELALSRLRSFGKTVIGIHLRRGDYGYGIFFTAPTQWYKDWLEGFWDTLDDPILFIASDDIDNVIEDFVDYMPITSRDLEIDISDPHIASFYPDFYLLSRCNAVAISNSSYSFAACLLNEVANFFFRPHLPSQKLVPFNPWNSEILLKDINIQDEHL